MKQLGAWQEIVQPTTVNGVSIRLPEFVLYTDKYMVSVRWNWNDSYWIARIYKRESKLLWWVLNPNDTLKDTKRYAEKWLSGEDFLLQSEDDDARDAMNEDWEANHG